MTQPPSGSETDTQPANPSAIAYLPGLDGLRALAVLAVLLYHAGYPIVGGYLGVESFFVLSGFLITTLLVADWQRHGRVRLGVFWLRRARRLLPALALTLAGTLLLTLALQPGELRTLAADTLAALLYVMNWKLIIAQQGYFDAWSRPPLLQHLWSLAIEEQFYLLWPLLFVAGMRLLRPRGLLVATLVAALASGALMAVLYTGGGDLARIYYGTDTRASALLIGAALALLWTHERRQTTTLRHQNVFEAAGLLALVALLACYVWLHEHHELLYLGGFPLVALATAAVITVATSHSVRTLPALLEARPLLWIGRRSYSLYLWHWPIFLLVVPPASEPWQRLASDALRLGLTVLLAALSYRFVEQPVRTHGFGGAWALLRSTPPRAALRDALAARPFTPALGALLVVLLSAFPLAWQSSSVASSRPTATALVAAAGSTPATLGASPTPQNRPLPTAEGRAAVLPPAGTTGTPEPGRGVTPVAPTAIPLPSIDPELATSLQAALDDAVADGVVPGAVLSVSVPGHAVWSGASGIADQRTERAMAPDTPVRIASVSKMFTAVVVLQLVEEGRLALDEPVATWLPDTVPGGSRVTVRHLLQHTSGIYDYLEDRRLIGDMHRDPGYEWAPEELVNYAARFPQRAIGRWDYSSTNYVVLGMLVEKVTGEPLALQVRQRIFEPLGMQSAAFLPYDPAPAQLARGYSYENDLTGSSMSFGFATANLAMTAADLERFGRALFTEELLRAETREQMLRFVSGRGQYDMPALAYGMGVMRNRLAIGTAASGEQRPDNANLVLGHIGGYGGFRSALWYAPDSGVVIAVGLNQAQTDPNDLAAVALDQVLVSMGR